MSDTGTRGRGARETRYRILAIALKLFSGQGYAGTSLADIAAHLGTSKAALYYHFKSKSEVLLALAEEPFAAFEGLEASAGQRTACELLGAVIDTIAGLRAAAGVIDSDPSAQAALRDLLPRWQEINHAITAALAGPEADTARTVRAQAAYAAAKNGTLALLAANGEPLGQSDRAELLAAAMRALAGPPAQAASSPDAGGPAPTQTASAGHD